MMRTLFILTCCLTSLLISGCETQPVHTSGKIIARDGNTTVGLAFSDTDRSIINKYYYERQFRKAPSHLISRDTLPPGLHKHIKRHGTLPPGLRGRSLPIPLERKLPKLPDDHVRIRLGTDILLLDSNSRIILDVIYDAVF